MTHWNYRVVHTLKPDGTPTVEHTDTYAVHEVYYEDGHICAWSDAAQPYGESPDQLRDDLMAMLKALDAPVLEREDLPTSDEAAVRGRRRLMPLDWFLAETRAYLPDDVNAGMTTEDVRDALERTRGRPRYAAGSLIRRWAATEPQTPRDQSGEGT